jgi:hypothetical protein
MNPCKGCASDECENRYDDEQNIAEFCDDVWREVSDKAKDILKKGWFLPALDETHLDLVSKIENERCYIKAINHFEVNGTEKTLEDFFLVLDNVIDAALDGAEYEKVGA